MSQTSLEEGAGFSEYSTRFGWILLECPDTIEVEHLCIPKKWPNEVQYFGIPFIKYII
jgi:hypothetical protein